MAKARRLIGVVGIVLLGGALASCLRPPAQSAPPVANVAAAAPAPLLAPVIPSGLGLPSTFAWTTTPPVIVPASDADHDLVAVKDPTVVRHKDRWHVFASSVGRGGIYNMVYTSFADWAEAPKAPLYYMDQTPGFKTYVAAPQVFYFTPQRKWYLVYQSGPPMYSTADDVADPSKWTRPAPFYAETPRIIDENGGWLDFWVICDGQFCHLFFSNDKGRWYRSKTSVADFPRGFGEPVVVMQDAQAGRLFEACNVYKIKGKDKYLALVEAFDESSNYRRYFRSWIGDSLEGPWTVMHDNAAGPFAGKQNVSGATWSNDISHGELIRSGYDEKMEVDVSHLQFLYQAFAPEADTSNYNAIPWQLGLLTIK